jgi:hypothetical protein
MLVESKQQMMQDNAMQYLFGSEARTPLAGNDGQTTVRLSLLLFSSVFYVVRSPACIF